MTIVLNLLERVMHDYYDIEHYNYIDINYSFNKNPDNSETYILNSKILSENLDVFISKYPSSARYVLKHNPDIDSNYQNLSPENKKSFCRLIATHNHKKARIYENLQKYCLFDSLQLSPQNDVLDFVSYYLIGMLKWLV